MSNNPYWIGESLRETEFSYIYAIGKELGKGPTAVVHKCEQRGSGPWAVKIIPKCQIKRKLFDVDIGALLRLKHPNVVRLREVYETEERIYMVCQLETGGDLLDRIVTHGRYTEQDIACCIRSILQGLAYLHQNDVTHRNLKPENLLYDGDVLKIADFGVSQIIGPEVRKHAVCSMPGYVAPEILQGECGSQAMDIWSVGIIAYLLLSGCEPFKAKSQPEVYKKIIKGQYTLRSEEWDCITENAKDLVRKLLVFNPSERMSAKQALMHMWVKGDAAGEEHLEETQTRLKQLNLQRKAQRVTIDFCLPVDELTPVPEPQEEAEPPTQEVEEPKVIEEEVPAEVTQETAAEE